MTSWIQKSQKSFGSMPRRRLFDVAQKKQHQEQAGSEQIH
jgi:hypothetical protein